MIPAKEYYCTDTEECPKDYSKLIEEKNECVISCGGEYPYEFENKCYKVCPDNTFYNYEHTFCIAAIPEGYYENATQTIDKCDIKCGECILGSVKQNLCVSCSNKIYYYKKEDDNANPDGYYECYTGSQDGFFIDLIDNEYKKCYKTCKSCTKLGNVLEQNCTECYEGSSLINYNCYIIVH